MRLKDFPHTTRKNKLKMDWRPKFKTQSLKLQKRIQAQQSFGIKAKINKRDLIPFKRFCTAKETLDKNEKSSLLNGGKDLWMIMTNKRLISKMLKQLIWLNIKKIIKKKTIKRWAKDLEVSTFSQGDITDG